MAYYFPWAPYPPQAYDDTWLRPTPPANRSPRPSNRPLHYEDDYWSVPRYGPTWTGPPQFYPSGYAAPQQISPTMMAAMVPLPNTPRISPQGSPRLGFVPLTPVAPANSAFLNPYYVAQPAVYPYPPNFAQPPPTASDAHRTGIHPLLNGEAPRLDTILDLSASSAKPCVRTSTSTSSSSSSSSSSNRQSAIHTTYLDQTATFPPTTLMKITCSTLSPYASDWVITIDHGGRHISVGDVLKGIHAALQKPISHLEWARLTESRSLEVSGAYTRRCRATDSFRSASEFERNQGVKRIDFLGSKYYFAGLVRKKVDDLENFKLVVRERDTSF